MTIDQALGILRPDPRTLEGLKKAHKAYILKYHPDRNPNGEELTKLGNAARDLLIKTLEIWTKDNFHHTKQTDPDYNIAEEIDAIYREIRDMAGLKITLAGTWLWVTGNTYTHKAKLKDLGFTWANKKKAWSWKPADYKKRYNKKEWTFDAIFDKYGKVDLDLSRNVQLATA